jgi:hypothetical protein
MRAHAGVARWDQERKVVPEAVVVRVAMRFFTREGKRGKRISYRHLKSLTLSPDSEELLSLVTLVTLLKVSCGD